MAEDLTQSAFLELWSDPDAFRVGNFGAWLSRVTRNRALDLVDIPFEGTVDDVVFARLDSQRVRSALAALPQEQRTPIELGFFGGITHEEIAERTGVPLGTIKTRIRTGLRRLRGELQGAVSR